MSDKIIKIDVMTVKRVVRAVITFFCRFFRFFFVEKEKNGDFREKI